MDNSKLLRDVQELLFSCKSAHARVNSLKACTCTKGKGLTRRERRFCDHCEALMELKGMRRDLEALKKEIVSEPAKTDSVK